MADIIRRAGWTRGDDKAALLTREWIVANGLGGYASGTVCGVCTRRYHGLLIAALPAPLGRTVMLSHLSERVRLPGGATHDLGCEESSAGLAIEGARHLADFHLEDGLPVWIYDLGDHVIEKRVVLGHLENAVHVIFRLISGEGVVRLKLRPSVHFRAHEAPVTAPHARPYKLSASEGKYELEAAQTYPPLRMLVRGEHPAFTVDTRALPEIVYRLEGSLGYESAGELESPGYFRVDLARDRDASLVAGTESWESLLAMGSSQAALEAERSRRRALIEASTEKARTGLAAELVLAADQFVIKPAGRPADASRARASGGEARSVIAGYHWFTDWGRDTMISLEGLTLLTGRQVDAGWILRTFARHVRDGLIPNLFPDREVEGLYHTADATLWFFHALARHAKATQDLSLVRELLPVLVSIVDHHVKGTRFGIGVDHRDGLLRQGAPGYQLTWMDAKVGDWVVTPRRGKAVEINALWYDALRHLERWLSLEGSSEAARIRELAERAHRSFNERFWIAEKGYLHDVVDGENGDDASLRPNQVFAISLEHPVLAKERWGPVLAIVERELLTPFGLRSLARGHPDYKPVYSGDLRSRDAAYHQGTVWAWLIGPFITAWLKANANGTNRARRFLEAFHSHLGEAGLGQVSEIFDAEPPFTPRGCIAQAWSVAEVLRCLVETAS